MLPVDFLKLHGLGNDFVLIDETETTKVPEQSKSDAAKRLCNRNTGVGGDGLIFLSRGEEGIVFRIFNSDGSEAEMCVNGIRCAALALKLRIAPELGDEVRILTKGGRVTTKIISVSGTTATVEVRTNFDPQYLGTKTVSAGGRSLEYHLVDVGNPHAVTFLEEDLQRLDVEAIGHALELHPLFQPKGINTEFVKRVAPGHLKMRVHERGACETMACGSGAIAAATAANQTEPGQADWMVEMRGGILEISLLNRVLVRGPATLVFEGKTSKDGA
jgi:diaminopimelate epimerase